VVYRADAVGAAAGVIRVESLDDPRVAEYRSITDPAALRRAGLFVAEGRFVVERLLQIPRFRVRSILVTAAQLSAFGSQRSALSAVSSQRLADSVPAYVVDQRVMDGIVGFNIHRGCVALAERPAMPLLADMPLATSNRVLVLEGVNNPDNIGGLFRSAAAFGIDAVILGPGCGDPLYRKAIRTSMAATLQVPFVEAGAWPDALTAIRDAGITVYALTPSADATLLDDIPRGIGRCALLVGGEGDGLSATAMAASDQRVRIATTDVVDSLNVAVATSIALHHFFR
jgi:tRNA G18 (ribose-2'-O)-methylase SpoU